MTTVIDTPEGIANWVILSRLFGLALEINTEGQLRPPGQKMPTIKMLELEGVIPKLRNTQKNRIIVLRAGLAAYLTYRPDWDVPPTICKAVI